MRSLLYFLGACVILLRSIPVFAGQAPDGARVIYPEVATRIQLSNTDINRFVCPEKIKDVIWSKEKGVVVRYSGKDAYVKFLIEIRSGGEKKYITAPTEIFIVCGDNTYNVIADPKSDYPAQTAYLSSGKQEQIKKNLTLYAGMPYEEKILSILKTVYTNIIPDSYNVSRVNKPLLLFRDINLTLVKVVEVDGEGLRVKEYSAARKTPKNDKSTATTVASSDDSITLREKDFLLKQIVQNPAAIAIDKHNLRTGDITRIFVIERTEDAGN